MSILEGPHRERAAMEARDLRQRLIAPAGAVPDQGIDLKRRSAPASESPTPATKPQPRIDPFTAVATQCEISIYELLQAISLVKSTRYGTREIILEVCEQTKIPARDLVSPQRTRNLIAPRHLAMALARRLTGQSLPMIGMRFGQRDHTTVLRAVHKMAHIIAAIDAAMPPGASVAEWVKAGLEQLEAAR